MHRSILLLVALSLAACQPPPPAPDGLDEASAFVIREFYSDDAAFGAGMQGFMNWFFDEGYELVGVEACDGAACDEEGEAETESFTVGNLTDADVGHLPEGEYKDLDRAAGVVSLAEMSCSWQVAEDFLVRPDQNEVFTTWDNYERTYLSDRATFDQATDDLSFDPVLERVDPYFDDAWDPDEFAKTFILTRNVVDAAPQLGGLVDLEPYDLNLDFRHGVIDLEDEDGVVSPTGYFAILTFITEPALDENEENGLKQSYSIEINVERPGNKTLRMLAVWGEPQNNLGFEPDDPIILNGTVNLSLEASEELNVKCAEADDGSYEGATESAGSCNAAGSTPSAAWIAILLAPLVRRRRA